MNSSDPSPEYASRACVDVRSPFVITNPSDMIRLIRQAQGEGKRVGLVPTMGALHVGHASLVAAAAKECQFIVVTIFVNPTQFGPGEDYQKYPRTLEADLEVLSPYPVDIVFAPDVNTMYRPGHATSIDVGPVARTLEGAIRPHHFAGVATVVLKLFNLAPADVAFFGQKDYQQTLVIEQMVADLDLPIELVIAPIVRESDGLAMSSRNVYLSKEDRAKAVAISQGLSLAESLIAKGERSPRSIEQAVRQHIEKAGLAVDYVTLAAVGTVDPIVSLDESAMLLVAARLGTTRLIDNCYLGPKGL